MVTTRILLVGGNRLVVEMLVEHLHYSDRYELGWVKYCDQALATLERRRFDLVLVLSLHVPWTMRHASGYSPEWRADLPLNAILFLTHMRALHHPPPVIVASGSSLADAEKEALAHGAFAFISKPFDLAELDHIVRLALESRTGER